MPSVKLTDVLGSDEDEISFSSKNHRHITVTDASCSTPQGSETRDAFMADRVSGGCTILVRTRITKQSTGSVLNKRVTSSQAAQIPYSGLTGKFPTSKMHKTNVTQQPFTVTVISGTIERSIDPRLIQTDVFLQLVCLHGTVSHRLCEHMTFAMNS